MSILTNQLKIFQNGAKINSVKINGGRRANRGVIVLFFNVIVVAVVVAVVIRRGQCEPRVE